MDHVSFTEAVERLAGRIGFTLHYEDGERRPRRRPRTAVRRERRPRRSSSVAQLGDARGRRRPRASSASAGSTPAPPRTSASASRPRAGRAHATTCGARVHRRGARGRRARLAGPARRLRPLPRPAGLADPRRDGRRPSASARAGCYDDDQGPKYLNTPETPIYNKSQVLYGLDLAKRDISRDHRVVVVEGYTDVMACHLAGITTAIATCGTAFGVDHITVLRRVMGDDSGVPARSSSRSTGCGGPEGGAARVRRRQALHRADVRRGRARRARPLRSAAAARRRRRARADGREVADVRVRHRPALAGSTSRPSRGGWARCAPPRPSSPSIRDPRCGPVRARARPPARPGARRGHPCGASVCGRPKAGSGERSSTSTSDPASQGGSAAPDAAARPFSIADLPNDPSTRLERDALQAMLQYPRDAGRASRVEGSLAGRQFRILAPRHPLGRAPLRRRIRTWTWTSAPPSPPSGDRQTHAPHGWSRRAPSRAAGEHARVSGCSAGRGSRRRSAPPPGARPTRPSTVARSKRGERVADHELEHRHLRVSTSARTAASPRLSRRSQGSRPVGRDGDDRSARRSAAPRRRRAAPPSGRPHPVEREDDLAGRRESSPITRRSTLMWSAPKAVPQVAIAVVTPARWHAMTSV